MQGIKFSLVMATLGRSDEIVLFMESLLVQSHTNFELIIVDQNSDKRVADIYAKYKDQLDIRYCRNEKKGLSLNRNIGLSLCSGDIIAFPDDDCEYVPDTLEKAARFFVENPYCGFYTCNTKDKYSEGAIFRAGTRDADISIFNFMSAGISFTIFVRMSAMGSFRFDERMGVGTFFGSGEESDLLLYLLRNKAKGRYHARHYIYHPAKPESPEKAFYYGKGFGAVYKKAVVSYHFFILLPVFFLRIAKGVINIIIYTDKKTRFDSLCGRIRGFGFPGRQGND
jgi:glycosyltransferase involved in cell wall biosynthesis